jgi:GT2 family glycosyltransferase
MKLSILIVNWNSRELLRKCLVSIRATCLDLQPQIVVVDNGSFDGCGEMLTKEFQEVEFLQATDNMGFGRSNNFGFARVTGDALLLLNPDTELKAGAVQTLLEQLKQLQFPGLLGPRLLNTNGSLQTSCVQSLPTPINQALSCDFFRRVFPALKLWGVNEAYASRSPVPVEAISGACMLLHSQTFRRVGGFDARYFMYAEDMDLCFKVRKAGLQVYHVPAAEVIHHGGASSASQFSKFSAVMQREALHLYMRLNYGRWSALAYRLIMGLSGLLRLLLLGPAYLFAKGEARDARCSSFRKWRAVLSWSLGLENWTKPSASGDLSNGRTHA